MENISFDIIVERFLRDTEFRMIGDDLVGRLALAKKRPYDISHCLGFLNGKIYPQSGVDQRGAIIHLSIFRAVLILIEPAVAPF